MRSIAAIVPQLTGTPTMTISIMNENDEAIYTSGNINENVLTRTALEQLLSETDYFKLTMSTVVEETLPIILELR